MSTTRKARADKKAKRAAKRTTRYSGTVTSVTDSTHCVVSFIGKEVSCTYPPMLAVAESDVVQVRVKGNDYAVDAILSGSLSTQVESVEFATSGNQSIDSGATSALTLWVKDDDISIDAGSWTADSGVFTCQRAGKYRVSAGVAVAGGGSGSWKLLWRINGVTVNRRWQAQGSDGTSGYLIRSRRFEVGDYFDIAVTNNTGGARNAWGGSADGATLTIEAMGT